MRGVPWRVAMMPRFASASSASTITDRAILTAISRSRELAGTLSDPAALATAERCISTRSSASFSVGASWAMAASELLITHIM